MKLIQVCWPARVAASLLLVSAVGRSATSDDAVRLVAARGGETVQSTAAAQSSSARLASHYYGNSGGETESASCDSSCFDSCDDDCCLPFWAHRSGVYGEFLYLHAWGADMAHAIQQNGSGGAGTVPSGRVGVVDPQYQPGFRLGFNRAINNCSSIGASYTQYRSSASDSLIANVGSPINAGIGETVRSLVLHPGTVNAGSTSTRVDADYDIDFQFVDIEFRNLLSGSDCHALDYVVGVRYGVLEQQFSQLANFSQPNGQVRTSTDIDMSGIGLKLGLDGRRQFVGGISGYTKGFLSLLMSEFQSEYSQFDNTTRTRQAYSTWDDERVVPVLEYEIGLTWTSCSGNLRISSGYYTAFWFNVINTAELIQATQRASFTGAHDTIAFDGFVTRAELRF